MKIIKGVDMELRGFVHMPDCAKEKVTSPTSA
jgi:hypothetical protein